MTMGFVYEREVKNLDTEKGAVLFGDVKAEATRLLEEKGEFAMTEAWKGITAGAYDSWDALAAVERLEREGTIRCIRRDGPFTQNRVYGPGKGDTE